MNVHKEIIEKRVFGGTVMFDKLASDLTNKFPCGHEQGSRSEGLANAKVECQIRGHDNVQESMSNYFQAELMSGDNAIECAEDDCKEKYDMYVPRSLLLL